MVTITIEEREIIEKAIRECRECFVGMVDTEGRPYVIPMNFGYNDDIIYLHSAPEGSSIRILENNPDVCITFCTETELTHQNREVACSYRIKGTSVICRGKVSFVEDFDEKVKVLDIIMSQYSRESFKYSDPSVINVKVWRVEVEQVSARIFGVPYKESHQYKK